MTETVSIDLNHESDDRPEVYSEDGRVVIRASALGGCIRNLVAARMGIRAVPFNDKALMRMGEGNIHEPHILKALERDGWEITSIQDELELPIAGGTIIIRGHSDGRAVHNHHGERAVEAKAMGRDVWDKWRKHGWAEFRRYAYQFSTYMHATGLPGLFATKNRDTGEIDVSLWDEAPISLTEIKARALKIAAAVELPECDPVQWGCSRFFLHTGGTHEIDPFTGLEIKKGDTSALAPDTVPEEKVSIFNELSRAYDEARAEQARAEAKRKEVGERLLDFLAEHQLTKGVTADWSVAEVTRKDRRLDQRAFKADHPALAEQYMVESVARYPKVTARGGDPE